MAVCFVSSLVLISMSDSQEVLTTAAAPPIGLAEGEAESQDPMQTTTDQPVSKRLGHFLTHRTFHHIILTLVRVFQSLSRTCVEPYSSGRHRFCNCFD